MYKEWFYQDIKNVQIKQSHAFICQKKTYLVDAEVNRLIYKNRWCI